MDHIGQEGKPDFDPRRGGAICEQRVRTEPGRFAAVLGARPRAPVLIEASADSEWVARCLEALGHEVIVADPNFAPMYATRTRKVKTDRRDAPGLGRGVLARRVPPRSSALRSPATRAGPVGGPGRRGPDAHAPYLAHPGSAPPARLPRPVRQCGELCPPRAGPALARSLTLGGRAVPSAPAAFRVRVWQITSGPVATRGSCGVPRPSLADYVRAKVVVLTDAGQDLAPIVEEIESIWREVHGDRKDAASCGHLQVLRFSTGSNAEMHGLFSRHARRRSHDRLGAALPSPKAPVTRAFQMMPPKRSVTSPPRSGQPA